MTDTDRYLLDAIARMRESAHALGGGFQANPWVHVDSDGRVTVTIDRSEMGQGVTTALSMLVAEELEVGLESINIRFAPASPLYNNTVFGEQITGGSTSVRGAWVLLRAAGASARDMLVRAAAQQWGVSPEQCRAENGSVHHPPTNRTLDYGDLVEGAARLDPPLNVVLKEPDQFRLLGRVQPRLDIPAMVAGTIEYGIDIELPDMRVAVVSRCPVAGGRPRRFDAARAQALPGVTHVIEIDSGIAVVADNFWHAQQGRDALEVEWEPGIVAGLNTDDVRQQLREAAARSGKIANDQGDVDTALAESAQTMQALYETPYLAHATLEPMNCTARVQAQRCDIWVGTQGQQGARETAAHYAGVPLSAVYVHTTYLGGGFGRRMEQDFVAEAVQVSKAVQAPIQVIWSRPDDMQHDHYRPANCARLDAGLDTHGHPTAWRQRIAGPDLALMGVDIPYGIDAIREEHIAVDPGLPTGSWRSVGASQNAFAVESFVDELAHAARRDPLHFRLGLLEHSPRHRGVLELAARAAGWGETAHSNWYQGIAVYRSFGSWVAHIAEVSADPEAGIRVHRVVCAIDCGQVVNPDTVAAQMEGAVVFGLSAALKEEITLQDGRVQQATFEDYPLLTLGETPQIEVHIASSRQTPGGVGEPGVPPVAPAVANAVFAATGQRLRRLPLRLHP